MKIVDDMEISDTLKGFDLFFDNIFSDILVQKKIKKMQIQVDDIIQQITLTLETLHTLQKNLEKKGQA